MPSIDIARRLDKYWNAADPEKSDSKQNPNTKHKSKLVIVIKYAKIYTQSIAFEINERPKCKA